MLIIYFLLWIIFNERLTLEVALIGIIISALLYLFTIKFMDYSPRKEWRAIRKIGRGLRYGGILVFEIIKANFGVMRFIVSPKYEVEPQLVYIKTKLKNDTLKTVLANSITLTPGTITVSAEENLMCIHCLDKTLSEGLEGSDFEKRLLEMEEMDK